VSFFLNTSAQQTSNKFICSKATEMRNMCTRCLHRWNRTRDCTTLTEISVYGRASNVHCRWRQQHKSPTDQHVDMRRYESL